jgi:hypothetical protein
MAGHNHSNDITGAWSDPSSKPTNHRVWVSGCVLVRKVFNGVGTALHHDGHAFEGLRHAGSVAVERFNA